VTCKESNIPAEEDKFRKQADMAEQRLRMITELSRVGFLEIDPDKGILKTQSSITSDVYVEYHIWHNLNENTV